MTDEAPLRALNARRSLLSTLWIFVMFNYLYADVFGLMDSAQLKQILSGKVGNIQITQSFLFAGALLMEVPIAMVVLSRLLPHNANRWANIASGTLKTAAVGASLFVGKPTIYYLFFSVIELACTLLIVWLAWRWRNPLSASG